MDSIVNFFEKLVSDFSWKRLVLVLAIIVIALVAVWGYESYTGRFRSSRMEFAVQHLTKLSEPSLRRNVHGDEQLEKAHAQLKLELNSFIKTSAPSGIPDPLLKSLACLLPWALLSIVMVFSTDRGQLRGALGGMLLVASPIVIVGSIIPTFQYTWINYIVYPWGASALVVGGVSWHYRKRPNVDPGQVTTD